MCHFFKIPAVFKSKRRSFVIFGLQNKAIGHPQPPLSSLLKITLQSLLAALAQKNHHYQFQQAGYTTE